MTEKIEDFSDDRHKAWCIHCAKSLPSKTSQDHVPSQCLLPEPQPAHLPTVPTCPSCNHAFSDSERYFSAFLGTVFAGEIWPSEKLDARSARILASDAKLRRDIRKSKQVRINKSGAEAPTWSPDIARLTPKILKNARGHAFYELGEPFMGDPVSLTVAPLVNLTMESRNRFESVGSSVWPEIGSRMMTRLAEGHDLTSHGWITVLSEWYRYGLTLDGHVVVRSVIREYLATEVVFDN